jgi:hypothetical protein
LEFFKSTFGEDRLKGVEHISPKKILNLSETKAQNTRLLGISLDKEFRRDYGQEIQSKITIEREGLEETITVEVESASNSGAY